MSYCFNRRRRRDLPSNAPKIEEMQENAESGDDESKELAESFPDGPIDISILHNFKTHVAAVIWYIEVIILIAK